MGISKLSIQSCAYMRSDQHVHAHSRLLCYAVVQLHELPLLRLQRRLDAGVFACDLPLLLSNSSLVLEAAGREAAVPISGRMDVPLGGQFRSALNTPLFLHSVWPRLLPVALSSSLAVDWVVKAPCQLVVACFLATLSYALSTE